MMIDCPLVSVIVPVYRAEKTLNYCVTSILGQIYRNIEIILIDDGSLDLSGSLCDEYAYSDSRVVVIHKTNGGVSDARNTALQVATGHYITFVDNDDLIPKDAFERMVSLAQQYKADVVQGLTERVKSVNEALSKSYDRKETIRFISSEELTSSRLRIFIWGKLYKREIVDGCFFPKGHYAEDVFFNGLIFSNPAIRLIVSIDRPSYYYMVSSASTSANYSANDYADMEQTVKELYAQIKEKSENQSITENYLRAFFSYFCEYKYHIIIRGGYSPKIRKQFLKDRRCHLKDLRHSSIPLYKKCAIIILSACNPLYRLFQYHIDPSMREYEKNIRMNRKINTE